MLLVLIHHDTFSPITLDSLAARSIAIIQRVFVDCGLSIKNYMASTTTFERERITLPSGLSLEAQLSAPGTAARQTTNKLAICLHPWSWLGGRMDDP